jgi:Protein of unknown function (DUF2490)
MLLGFTVIIKAQVRTVSHASQQWMQVYTQTEINEKNAIWIDAGMRQTHNGQWPSQRLIRVGLAYALPIQMQGVTGIARFSFQQQGKTNKLEWRIWQEINRNHKFSFGNLQQRLRAEARFFEIMPNGGNAEGHSFNMRFRYRLQATVPVTRIGQQAGKSPMLLLSAADEFFLNTGREIIHNTLDNNRLVIGPALKLNPALTIAMLYNHQYGHRSNRNTAESAEICWLTINWKGQLRASDKSGRFQ